MDSVTEIFFFVVDSVTERFFFVVDSVTERFFFVVNSVTERFVFVVNFRYREIFLCSEFLLQRDFLLATGHRDSVNFDPCLPFHSIKENCGSNSRGEGT